MVTSMIDKNVITPLYVQVANELRKEILSNQYGQNGCIGTHNQLADRFGVSRGTIREAVKLLVSRGVLRVKHGSGTYVASLMPLKADPLGLDAIEDRIQLALDLTDMRLMLEPAIAELAARNRTEEEAQRLTEYCDAVRRRIQAGEDYLIEDMRFHWYLAKCSHNMVVEPLMPIIDAAVVSIANITRKELLTATVDTHQEILSGVLDQDPQAARAAMALQDLDGLAHLKGVADIEAERDIHVGHDGDHVPAAGAADAYHALGELLAVFERLHERAGADLDVQHDRMRAGRQLFGLYLVVHQRIKAAVVAFGNNLIIAAVHAQHSGLPQLRGRGKTFQKIKHVSRPFSPAGQTWSVRSGGIRYRFRAA